MEITFFKNQNLHYSYFSRQWIYEEFDKDPQWEDTVSVTLNKTGDLLHHSYLVIQLAHHKINLAHDKLTLYTLYNDIPLQQFINDPQNNIILIQYINFILTKNKNNTLNSWIEQYTKVINDLDMLDYINKIISLNTVYGDIDNVYSDDESVPYDTNFEIIKSIENTTNINIISEQEKNQVVDIIDISESIELYIFFIMMNYINIMTRIENNKKINSLQAKKNIIDDTILLKTHIANNFFNFELDVELVDNMIYYLIDNIELKINDSIIDNYSGDFMHLMDKQLTKKHTYTQKNSNGNIIINYPLHFWFNKYSSDALPVSAMKYSNIEINILFNKLSNVIKNQRVLNYIDTTTIQNAIFIESLQLLNEYIYVMPFERKKFMTTINNYLIHQHQYFSDTIKAVDSSINYYLVRPCTHLFWGVKNTQNNSWYPLKFIELGFSSDEIFQNTDPFYYNTVQPTQHGFLDLPKNIYMYSFSLHLKNLQQPSGSINMTVIPNKFIHIIIDDECIHNLPHSECQECLSLEELIKQNILEFNLWAINRNVFSVQNGYGTLDY